MDTNVLQPVELPHQMKRRVKKQQASTNDRLKAKGARGDRRGFKNQKHVDLMAFNASAEDQFVEDLRKLIEESGRPAIAISKVYQECSYNLNVSPQTVKRYLVKHSASRAEFRVFGKDVMLNPKYQPDEEDDEEEDE